MLSEKNALVLLWTGEDLRNDTTFQKVGTEIVNVLMQNKITIPEMVKVIYKDQDAISKAVLKESKCEIQDETQEGTTLVKQSIIYISNRFKLNEIVDITDFCIRFQTALMLAKATMDTESMGRLVGAKELEHAKALFEATKCIFENYDELPTKLCRKYGMTDEILNIIVRVYENVM